MHSTSALHQLQCSSTWYLLQSVASLLPMHDVPVMSSTAAQAPLDALAPTGLQYQPAQGRSILSF